MEAFSFFFGAFVGTGDGGVEERFPFGIGELDVVERFELGAQVRDEGGFVADVGVFVGLRLELFDEGVFELRFGLVGVRCAGVSFVDGDDGRFIADRDGRDCAAAQFLDCGFLHSCHSPTLSLSPTEVGAALCRFWLQFLEGQ